MKIQNNSRQIPSAKTMTSNKEYFDTMYSVLQEKSHLEVLPDGTHIRYLEKKEIPIVKLAEWTGVTRQTASSRFKNLEKLKLIEYDDVNKRYVLTYLERSFCTLVPQETLRKMNNALSRHSVSLFVYLMNRYLAAGEKEYLVTMSQMKEYIGLTTQTTSNNVVINDIMEILQKLGLIKYDHRIEDSKMHIYIKKVNNIIE